MVVTSITCVSTNPAWADDPNAIKPTAATQPKSGASHLVAWPKAVAGFCAGAIIGTPICFVKKFPKEASDGAHSFVGSIGNNDNKKLLYIPVYAAWLPVASFITLCEAPGYAIRDAYMAEKPFSKEQFSLVPLDE